MTTSRMPLLTRSGAVLALAITLALAGCGGGGPDGEAKEGELVLAERAGKSERAGVKVVEVIGDPLAPKISGVIAQRMAKPGNLIQLNSSLFRIVDDSRLEAVLNVPERDLATMKPGLTVHMAVDAMPGRVFAGEIDRVSPVVDAGSGTFRVVTAFAGKDGLRPGMFGRIQVVYDERADALTVPRAALLEDGGETAVFAVREKKAVRVPIEVGHLSGELAEVRKGLVEGDQVVTAGKITLRDGAEVEVLNPPAAGTASEVAQVAQSSGTGND